MNLKGPWPCPPRSTPSGYRGKGAIVNSLTESAAITYGPEGIRVNAIAPGTTLTEMLRTGNDRSPGIVDKLNAHTPLRRAADPYEIAQAAVGS
ncbi:SDR family oxidoreductase [Rhodococcus opacus]|uniref:SDR family oxidoreductase n=1 Tax=Rhodococcus opacus TaxID=37919 RepID=UPI001FF3F3BD|nr:SDR family oxidoreductase [Rhodococcus opacus]UOT03833.1 SDR family oxidoreductase [Rhodococcus opacus]